MMRSLFSGVSGLRVHQTRMDVIANNIANVNTVGFKASRMTFQDVFSQTLTGASKANEKKGGTNPQQIGLGVMAGSIDLLMTSGVPQRTDSTFDLMINGEGFFIVNDASGTYFTRAGNFGKDLSGNIVNSNGMFVMGWQAIPDEDHPGEFVIQKAPVSKIQITDKMENIDPTSTSYVKTTGTLNPYTNPERVTTMYVYDTLGNYYTMDVRYKFDEDADEWTVSVKNSMKVNGDPSHKVYLDGPASGASANNGDPTKQGWTDVDGIVGQAPFGDGAEGTPWLLSVSDQSQWTPDPAGGVIPPDDEWIDFGVLQFDKYGNLLAAAGGGGGGAPPAGTKTGGMTSLIFNIQNIPLANGGLAPETSFGLMKSDGSGGVTQGNIILSFVGLKAQAGAASAGFTTMDGNAPGTLSRIAIDPQGMITGAYTNGDTRLLGQIAIANFKNPAGLEKVGNNLFAQTRNSGEFDSVGIEAADIGSSIMAGVLEMANVDLASEFTEMITTQRGFQANSRIISTSDEMLQELVNLKR